MKGPPAKGKYDNCVQENEIALVQVEGFYIKKCILGWFVGPPKKFIIKNLSSIVFIDHYDQPDHQDHLQQFQHVNNNDQDYDLHDQDLDDTTTQTDHFNFL